MKIYLGDLVYDTIKTNYVVPLNIGFVAANLDGLGGDVNTVLFKYPTELVRAIKQSPPDILGLSNYSWNHRLNAFMVALAKRENPDCITVMGGPHIRIDRDGISSFLLGNQNLDYYVLYEGEEVFRNLVERILGGIEEPPEGSAKLFEGELVYQPVTNILKRKIIDYPSPYLSGHLDAFLQDQNMIPLLETNRGCPYGCVYCSWGISALSRIRQRDLGVIFEEIEYVARKSAGQVNWIFCDANFGILERDVEIARHISSVREKYGFPLNVTVWHSKNTSERNIEISETLEDESGSIALQSTDPVVLKNCGRGKIKVSELERQIAYYHGRNLAVRTDILIGLPGESMDSHYRSLHDSFEIGFDSISPYNIRMLPGSKYETDDYRQKYGVMTAFRPIFGCYGEYDGIPVLECEESIRATKDMSEDELESFKIIHWLIFFCWNIGFGKPLLRFGHTQGINPLEILFRVSQTDNPILRRVFDEMHESSKGEWFASEEDFYEYYKDKEAIGRLAVEFCKLNMKYIAMVYQDHEAVTNLGLELRRQLMGLLEPDDVSREMLDNILYLDSKVMCLNLLDPAMVRQEECPSSIMPFFFHDVGSIETATSQVLISRPEEYVEFCHYHLVPNGEKDFSITNIVRFLEIGGMKRLRNRVEILPPDTMSGFDRDV